MRPSTSGSATFIARSDGESPRVEAAHCSAPAAANTTCNTGASASSSTAPPASSSRAEKAVVLRMMSGLFAREEFAQGRASGGVLQARDIDAGRREAARLQRLGERVDRGEIVGEVDRAVEDDEGARGVTRGLGDGGRAQSPKAATPRAAGAASARHKRQASRRCSPARLPRNSSTAARSASRSSVDASPSRASSKRSPGTIASAIPLDLRERRQFLDAVAPIIHAAQQAHEYEARPGADLLQIEIDGIGMFQRGEIGEPKARARRAAIARRRSRSAARSLSVKDRTRQYRRRTARGPTASAVSSNERVSIRAICMSFRQARQQPLRSRRDRGPSRRSRPAARAAPRRRARAGRTHAAARSPTPCTSSRIGLPATSTIALDAQHVMRARSSRRAAPTGRPGRRRRADRGRRNRNRRGRGPLPRRDARGGREIVLGAAAKAEQHVGLDAAFARGDHLHRPRASRPRSRRAARRAARAKQDRPCSARPCRRRAADPHRPPRADFRDRARGRRARWAATFSGSSAKRPSATAAGVDHRDHAVDGQPRAQIRPVERLHQRLRQRQPRGLDDDVVGARLALQQGRRWRAAKSSATVQQMQPLASSMILSSGQASTPQPFRISPSTPTSPNSLMIKREPPAPGVSQDVADQRRLAGAEKAGDDRDGNLREHGGDPQAETSGGVREITPLRKGSGRSRHGTRPSEVCAKRRAAVTMSSRWLS